MILIFTQAFCHMCVENLLKGFATPRACQAYMFFYIHCISKTWRMSESSFSHLFIAVFPFSFVSNATNLFFQQVCFKKTAAYTLLVLFNWVSFLFLAYANKPFNCFYPSSGWAFLWLCTIYFNDETWYNYTLF